MTPDFQPPKRFRQFFQWICHSDHFEELAGDLDEKFMDIAQKRGIRKARNWYRREILYMIRPSVLKKMNFRFFNSSGTVLYNGYFKIAWRNVLRHKLFSFINLLGLAASMSLGLLMIVFIHDILQFDQFHAKKEHIYRVVSETRFAHYQADKKATTALPVADILKDQLNGIEAVVSIRSGLQAEVKANKKIIDLQGYYTEPSFLSVFSFPLLYGNPAQALADPYSIIITQKVMDRLFDGKDPVGQEIEMGDLGLFTVRGVLEDIPEASHLQFEVLASSSTLAALEKQGKLKIGWDDWDNFYSNYVYALFQEDQSVEILEENLNALAVPAYDRYEDLTASFSFQPITKIVPGPDLSRQIGPKMIILPIIILSAIALAILLSACFNYTNLSIARALRRNKEIGMRKVLGASRGQISQQFLIESVFISILALFFSIGIFQLIRTPFMDLIPRAHDLLQLQLGPLILFYFVLFAIFAGILAGFFPARVLSGMHPGKILTKSSSGKLLKKISTRKALIVFQFCISLFFILATTIILRQYQFTLNYDMGFTQENILNVDLQEIDPQFFQDEFAKLPEVKNVSFSSLIPGTGSSSSVWFKPDPGQNDSLISNFISVDQSYLDNHNLHLEYGQFFPDDLPMRSEPFIVINQQMAKTLEWEGSEALDQTIWIQGQPNRVIGVIKDFNYNHLEEPIGPFFFSYQPDYFTYANVKVSSDNISKTIQSMKAHWQELNPERDFSAQFLDDQIEQAYNFLLHNIQIFGFLAFLAIAIACLGMLGMAVYTMETKLKEISIRKVFGAASWQLIWLLSKGFLKLLVVAIIIATPLVFLLFDRVILANFAFRIKIGFLELSQGIFLLLILGFLTIGTQTIAAAKKNPADTLRSAD